MAAPLSALLSPKSDSFSAGTSKSGKESIYKFLQPETNILNTSKRGDLKFIPYIQERDHLGHLLSKQSSNRTAIIASPKESVSAISNVRSFEHSPEPKNGRELGYDQFRYLPKIPTSDVKASLKRILKPDLKSKSMSSACFLSSERPPVATNGVPSVGYYEASDKLLHPNMPGISFSKQGKAKFSGPKYDESTAEDVDIMKSYNKVYQKSLGGAEFIKQTTRDNHFMNKLQSPFDQKPHREENTIQTKYLGPKKDSGNDVAFMLKHALQVSPKNLPLTMPGMNDKFGQIKAKYKIFYNKLR